MSAPLCPYCGSRKSRAVLPSRDPLEYYCLTCHRHWLLPEPDQAVRAKEETEPKPRRRRRPQ